MQRQPGRLTAVLLFLMGLVVACGGAEETPLAVQPTATPRPFSLVALAGDYEVTGTNPDGSTYAGTLEMTSDGKTLSLIWETGTTLRGTGLLLGDRLVVGWGQDDCTVAGYRLRSDGTLEGQRLFVGGAGLSTERATRALGTRGTLSGEYKVAGRTAGGSAYEEALAITEDGDVYQFAWQGGDASYQGVGIRRGSDLAVGWGSGACGVVLYEVSQGELNGEWGIFGESRTGTEEATRK